MDEPENIQAFNYLTLLLFDKLYEAFPDPIEIRGLRFVVEAVVEEGPESENTKRLHLLTQTINWLTEEGFIRHAGSTQGGDFLGVVLTMQGLVAIGYAPASISGERKTTVIAKTKELLRKGAAAAGSEVVHATVGALFAGLMRNAGAG